MGNSSSSDGSSKTKKTENSSEKNIQIYEQILSSLPHVIH